MNCSSFRNSSTKLSEGHNWPGRSLHRRWRICWGLSSAKDQTLEFRTCKYVKTVWWLEVRNFIPREGLHSVNFVDRWPLGRATATFHGRVMHHCYEWRSSQFPCKMQDIARSLAWSVCVIETDRRWRCLADWNGWTFLQSIAIQLHVKDSRTARVIVQPKTGPFAARACYLPSTSREFQVDIFRLAAFAPFSLFAFPSSSEPWQSGMLG